MLSSQSSMTVSESYFPVIPIFSTEAQTGNPIVGNGSHLMKAEGTVGGIETHGNRKSR